LSGPEGPGTRRNCVCSAHELELASRGRSARHRPTIQFSEIDTF
jgi:hypothetical protein